MTEKANKTQAAEARSNFPNGWTGDLWSMPFANPKECLLAVCCPNCVAFYLRYLAIDKDLDRYICCNGGLPCSGRLGESRCPGFCMATEACCCMAQSVVSTRWILQEQYRIRNTATDNAIIGCMIWLQYLSCLCNLLACVVDVEGVDDMADAVDCLADVAWCSVCACMQSQQWVQMKDREENPTKPLYANGLSIDQVAPKRFNSGPPKQH